MAPPACASTLATILTFFRSIAVSCASVNFGSGLYHFIRSKYSCSVYEPKAGHEVDDELLLDPLEFVARVLIHIPEALLFAHKGAFAQIPKACP